MGNSIVHVEIAGLNGPELESFYRELFGWEIDHQGEGDLQYGFIKALSEPGLSGGIRHEPGGKPEVVFYVEVDDLNATVKQAEQLGGQTRIAPTDTGNINFAIITDPQGNPVGMVQKA